MVRAAAQVVWGALSGTSLTQDEIKFFKTYQPSGLTLFDRNVIQGDPQALRSLLTQVRGTRPQHTPPCVIAIDQEGGRVARLKHPSIPNLGPSLYAASGGTDPHALSTLTSYGLSLGGALRQLGIHVDFAPVVDIKEDHTHDSIGDRAFARDTYGVALRAGAFLDGLQQSGIQGCLKHFPGLGRSQRDTHFSGEVIHGDLGTLLTHDMLPYQTLLRKAPMVMLAHAIYPAVSLTEASCSATFVDLLRSFYEFEGLILSDDMTMGAIASHTCVASMIDALSAGVDFVLICKDLDLWAQAIEAIDTQMKKSPWFHKRVEHAAQRMALFQKHLPPSWPWP